MKINSGRSLMSTTVAALLWRMLNYSQGLTEREGMPRLLCLPSDFLGKHIICNGVFEREIMEFVGRILDVRAPIPDKKSIFFDVGANIGNHTCFFASRFDVTISAEPSMVVASILRANILLNNLQDKVFVLEAAISSRSGAAIHYTSKGDNLGGSSLDDKRRDTLHAEGKEVKMITGDEAVSQITASGAVVSFVKIDVEGHEYEVIQGLAETLRRDHPVLLFEVDAGPAGPKCFDLLRQLGYCKFVEIVGDADAEIPTIVRFVRRVIRGTREIEVHEISKPESRYYEAILALPPQLAHCIECP